MSENSRQKEKQYRHTVSGLRGIVTVLIYVVIGLGIFLIGKTAYSYGYHVFHEEAVEAAPGHDVEIMIPQEASAYDIGKILKEGGLIKDAFVFVGQEYLSAYHGKEEAGVYTLNTSQTPTEMLCLISPEEEEES